MYTDHHFIRTIKHYKFLFAFIVFLALFILAFLFAVNNASRVPTPNAPTPDITPGVAKNNLTLITILPKNNSKNIGIYPKIEIAFSRSVESFEKSQITFTTTPSFKARAEWSRGENILTILPQDPLLPNQFYVATVRYYDQTFTWSFTTTPLSDVSTADQIKAQSLADQNYAEAIKKMDIAYPWLQSLPLQTETYFVYFDPEKKQMIALLYPKTSSQTPISEQVTSMKTDILQQLEALGIDVNRYPPQWKSTPES